MKYDAIKMMFLVTAVFLSGAAPVAAKRIASTTSADGQVCKMVETVTVSLSYSNIPVSLDAIQSNVDSRLAEIETIAKDVGIENLIISNMNYNIYGNNGGGCGAQANTSAYQLNGSYSLQLPSSEQASALIQALSEKNYVPNLNVNSYRQCQ